MIDLRSDTVTRPGPAMRRAMADAEVGDDVLDGDPTVRALEDATAEALGTARALFFPTGTMANQAAVMVLTRPGTEIFVHEDSHIVNYEMAGAAQFAGVQPRMMRGAPRVTAELVTAAIRSPSPDSPRATLMCVENTFNGAGGMVTPPDELAAIAAVARRAKLNVHLDGARLWNAAAALDVPLARFTASADLTMVAYSKGLGAPVGAALAGSAAYIDEAWDARKRLGGGMRQSGIIAAGALYGLRNHLGRLSEDHANARRLAAIIAEVPGVAVVAPDTNIVMIDLPAGVTSAQVAAGARERGVRVSTWLPQRVRCVTHLDASSAEVEYAATTIRDVVHALVRGIAS